MHLPRANWPANPAVYIPPLPPGPPVDVPPLAVGDRCRLPGGGPLLLVVQVEDASLGDDFMVAWKSPCAVGEYAIDRAAVRRA